jgi:tetratricopeptide (TPR) repeat protein
MTTIAPLLIEAERSLEQDFIDRAAALYQRALELDQERSPLPTIGLGRVALLLGKLDEAQALLDHALSLHPHSVEALTYRGVVADARRNFNAAVRYFERALSLDSRYSPAHSNMGRVLAQLGRWPQALKSFRTALALSPMQHALMPLLATAAVRAGEIGEAIQVLTRMLQHRPDHIDGIVTLADVLMEAKLGEFAAELLANAVDRLPQVPVLYARQSAVALRRGDLKLARLAAERHLALTPNDEEALLYAATLDLMKRDVERAERRVQHALSLNPGSWRAHYQLGLIYDALRMRDPAKAAYRNAIAHGPKAWEPRNNLATMLLEERTPASSREARLLLEQALALGPTADTLDARYNLALAHWQLGEKGASERAAREVAAVPVERPVVSNARRFLKNFARSAS